MYGLRDVCWQLCRIIEPGTFSLPAIYDTIHPNFHTFYQFRKNEIFVERTNWHLLNSFERSRYSILSRFNVTPTKICGHRKQPVWPNWAIFELLGNKSSPKYSGNFLSYFTGKVIWLRFGHYWENWATFYPIIWSHCKQRPQRFRGTSPHQRPPRGALYVPGKR